MNEFYEKLKNKLPDSEVLSDEPMSRHTTFRVGGKADIYVNVAHGELKDAVMLCKNGGVPFTVIGNGSNILVGDGGIRGAVIELGNRCCGIEIQQIEDDGSVFVRAEAGAMLSSLSSFAAEQALTGLEFASGIPGTVALSP